TGVQTCALPILGLHFRRGESGAVKVAEGPSDVVGGGPAAAGEDAAGRDGVRVGGGRGHPAGQETFGAAALTGDALPGAVADALPGGVVAGAGLALPGQVGVLGHGNSTSTWSPSKAISSER